MGRSVAGSRAVRIRPPMRFCASIRTTLYLASARGRAAARPAMPAPMTAMSAFGILLSRLYSYQNQGIGCELQFELAILQRRFLRRGQSGLAVELVYLRWSRVKRFAHGSVGREHVARLAVHDLFRNARVGRNSGETQAHGSGWSLLVRVDQVPGGDDERPINRFRYDYVAR